MNFSNTKANRPDPGAVTVTVECLIKHKTEKALLVKAVEGRDKQNWIAKSQLKRATVDTGEGGLFIIFVPTWIAKSNGWNYGEYDPEDYPAKDISDYDEIQEQLQFPEDDKYDDDIPF